MAEIPDLITTPLLDACTLNNVLNIAQLVALVALIKWLREGDRAQ